MTADMDWVYSDIVKEHFVNPRNVFDSAENFQADAQGLVGNINCGDQMLLMIKVKDDVIQDIRWKTYGCASAIASTSMLSEVVKGLGLKEAYGIQPKDIAERLGGLPDNKIHCSVMGDKALRAAIEDYLAKTGRKGLFGGQEAVVICTCLNVTDKDIEEAVKNGARTWEGLQARTKIGTVCGKCRVRAEELVHEFVHLYG
jgi:NifU-like protein